MTFAQGRDFTGQRPYDTDTLCRCPRNNLVMSRVRHAARDGVCSIHSLTIPFRPLRGNSIGPHNSVRATRFGSSPTISCHLSECASFLSKETEEEPRDADRRCNRNAPCKPEGISLPCQGGQTQVGCNRRPRAPSGVGVGVDYALCIGLGRPEQFDTDTDRDPERAALPWRQGTAGPWDPGSRRPVTSNSAG